MVGVWGVGSKMESGLAGADAVWDGCVLLLAQLLCCTREWWTNAETDGARGRRHCLLCQSHVVLEWGWGSSSCVGVCEILKEGGYG